MISIQSPNEFLSGINNVGSPLNDVILKINYKNTLSIKTERLAIGYVQDEKIDPCTNRSNWLETSDKAKIMQKNKQYQLTILKYILISIIYTRCGYNHSYTVQKKTHI